MANKAGFADHLLTTADSLYFIAEVPDGCIKIGRAKDPLDRLRKMQVGNSRTLELVAVVKNGGWMEAFWHECFRPDHARGEWFHDTTNLRKAMKSPRFTDFAPIPPGVDDEEWAEHLLDALELYEVAVLFEGAEPFAEAAATIRGTDMDSTGALDAFLAPA